MAGTQAETNSPVNTKKRKNPARVRRSRLRKEEFFRKSQDGSLVQVEDKLTTETALHTLLQNLRVKKVSFSSLVTFQRIQEGLKELVEDNLRSGITRTALHTIEALGDSNPHLVFM